MKDQCSQCGVCCKLFLINLTEKEYNSKKYQTQFEEFGFVNNFKDAEEWGANIIKQNKDGSCIYQIENKCSIHKTRPEACLAFFCTSKDENFREMIKKINIAKK